MNERYVIADIEATGLGAGRQMIELALITWQDQKITDVFQTLINPLTQISSYISELTSISSKQLELAPRFDEIAERVKMRLDGTIFVSHNVDFDWPMLQGVFDQMGIEVKVKTLCTLKLAQELIPGMKSYTLHDLCAFFRIPHKELHRAMPDAEATLALLKELLKLKTIPRHLAPKRFHPRHEALFKKIPALGGVLTLLSDGQVLKKCATPNALAKAQDLLSIDPSNRKLLELCDDVIFEATGSDLIAQFLIETKKTARWMIVLDESGEGMPKFLIKHYRPNKVSGWVFKELSDAKAKLRELKEKLPRPKYAWSEGGVSKEEKMLMLSKARELLKETRFPADNLLLSGPGRKQGEWSYVLVLAGKLVGWGFDSRAPEDVVENPRSVIEQKAHGPHQELAVRYLREHRNNRHKDSQWREIKEVTC